MSKLSRFLLIVLMALPSVIHSEPIVGDNLEVVGYLPGFPAEDIIVMKNDDAFDSSGGLPGSRLLLVDPLSQTVQETIVTAYHSFDPYHQGRTDDEVYEVNHQLFASAMMEIEGRGFIPAPEMRGVCEGLCFELRQDTVEDGSIVLDVCLKDWETGFEMIVGSTYPNSDWEHLYSLSSTYWSAPGGNTAVAFLHRNGVMEFDPGSVTAIVVNRFMLSTFHNKAGFEHYKNKDYESALYRFQAAHDSDSIDPKPIFNMACMHALSEDVEGTLSILQKLVDLGSVEAWEYFDMVHKDGDFDKIRTDPRFVEFMSRAPK